MGLQRIHARVARLAKMGYRGFTTLVEEGEDDVTEEVLLILYIFHLKRFCIACERYLE